MTSNGNSGGRSCSAKGSLSGVDVVWLTIGWSGVVMKSLRNPLCRHMLGGKLSVWHCQLCLRMLRVHLWLLVLMRRIH